MRCDRRCGAAPIGVVRRRAQAFEPEPDTRSLVADEIAPPAGALLLALVVAAERDRPGARDQHDAAAHWVAGIEGGDGVVGHVDADRRADELGEDRTPALSVRGARAARAREGDRG